MNPEVVVSKVAPRPVGLCLVGLLGALALNAVMGGSALAAPPATSEEARLRWQQALAGLGVQPDCVSVLGAFLAPSGDSAPTSPGTPLERTPPDGHGILLRLERSGGIPFWGPKDHLARAHARFDVTLPDWVPPRDDLAPNRGYALWTPVPGRDLLVVDHMRSPVSAATSIWEDTGKKVVLRAELPAEILSIEDRGGELVLHASDSFNAVAIVWDLAAGAFVGKCLVRGDAAASYPRVISDDVFLSTPVTRKLAKRRPLKLLPPSDGDASYRLATLSAREQVIVLFTQADGATFVLAPWRDTSQATALYRREPARLWQLGWLAPGTLAGP